MQTLKFLSVTCLGAALLVPCSSHAVPDSEKQAQLREAMRKQMEQAAAPTSAPAPVVTPAPVPQPAVVVPVQTTPVVTPVAVPQANVSTEEERAALRRKMEEMQGIAAPTRPAAPVAPVPAKPVRVAPAPVAAPVAAPVFSAPPSSPVVVAPAPASVLTTKNPNAEAERAALRQKIDAMPVAAAPTPAFAPAPKLGMPKPPVFAAPVFTPTVTVHAGMTPPASPFPATKLGKLEELLRRYRADEITPQEYHTQRAALIAEH